MRSGIHVLSMLEGRGGHKWHILLTYRGGRWERLNSYYWTLHFQFRLVGFAIPLPLGAKRCNTKSYPLKQLHEQSLHLSACQHNSSVAVKPLDPGACENTTQTRTQSRGSDKQGILYQ